MSEQNEINIGDVSRLKDKPTDGIVSIDQLQPDDIKPGQQIVGFTSVQDLDKAEAVIVAAMKPLLDPTKDYTNGGLHTRSTPGFLSDVLKADIPDAYPRTLINNIRVSIDAVDDNVVGLVNSAKSASDPEPVDPNDITAITVTRELQFAGSTRVVSSLVAYFPQKRINGTMREPRPYVFRVIKKGKGTDLDKINNEIGRGRKKSAQRLVRNFQRPHSAGLPTLGKRR